MPSMQSGDNTEGVDQ